MKDIERLRLNAIIFNQREQLRTLQENNARLKKQLADANSTMKSYAKEKWRYGDEYIGDWDEYKRAEEYLEKWNVK